MQIRTAVPADLQGIVNIEAECFPAAEAATEASLSGRLASYPNHFWVQLDGDRMIGFVNHVIGEAKAQGRKGLVLTCKDKLVHYYTKFGFVSEGVSGSTHGNVVWYQMRLSF